MTRIPADTGNTGRQSIEIRQLGQMAHDDAMRLQGQLVEKRAAGKIGDTLLLLEHPPTYTVGLRGGREHFRVSERELEARGAEVRRVDRGGAVTFHGPGQLVGYPILDVRHRCRNIARYVYRIEQMLIDILAVFGLQAGRLSGYRGVWVNDRKIAAIGVRVNSAGISSHGFALNVNTDLSYFDAIVACGIPDRAVTSLAREMKRPAAMSEVIGTLSTVFVRAFDNGSDFQTRRRKHGIPEFMRTRAGQQG